MTRQIDLDAVQRRVLALPDDADAVVIGAGGTGKTTLAVEVVADRLLVRHRPADAVLALAATRASAGALRDRLAGRVGIPTPGPLARTVASLAFEIVRGAAAADGRPAPTLLTGADQDRIVADLLAGEILDGADGAWPEAIDASVRQLAGFRAELRELQARMLERGMTPDALDALGRAEGRDGWVAAARFLAVLESVQDSTAPGAADAAELAVDAAVAVLAGAPVSRRLELLVVDDAHELGVAGLRLVEALAASGVRVVLLGDPDLATGGFRGAQPGGFIRVPEVVGRPVAPLVLPIAHRQTPAVRAAVAAVTGRIGTAGAGAQRAAVADADAASGRPDAAVGGVSAVRVGSRAAELALVARTLRERRVREGVAWSSMAVVVRSGAAVPGIVRELRALEVPASSAGVLESPREDAGVRALVLALEVALGRRELDAEVATELLGGAIGRLDVVALRRLRGGLRQEELAAGGDRGAAELLVEAMRAPGAFRAVDTRAGHQAQRVAESLRLATAAAAPGAGPGASVEELLWGLWERADLAALWGQQASGAGLVADEANRHLDAVVALFAAAKRFVERSPDAPPGGFIDEWTASRVQEDSLAPRGRADAVLVGTPSALVGREFDAVVVCGLQDGAWPDPRVRGSLLGVPDLVDRLDGRSSAVVDRRREVLHDELRLFAATLARAARFVLATGVDGEDEAPSPFLRLLPPGEAGADHLAPLTLRGLVARLRRDLVRTGSPAAAAALARLAAESVPGADPAQWAGLAPVSTTVPLVDLADPDAVVPVSPSRIEAFETCPLHWAVERLGGARSSTGANLGTLVHAVAQEVVDEDADHDADALLHRVLARWGELEFETEWASERAALTAREVTARLASYLRDVRADGGVAIGTELPFEVRVGRASLRGMIDRIERYDDGELLVVDLKTGREPGYGTDASVADHAQLGAYQLAVDAGAVDGIEAAAATRGAALVILSRGTRDRDYVRPVQAPFDDAGFAAFRDRVEAAAEGMAGPVYLASIGAHCLDPWSHGACRIHVVRAVTA